MKRTPSEIARAIEIVLSSVKMDRKTAEIMRSHLECQRKLIDAQMAPYLVNTRD